MILLNTVVFKKSTMKTICQLIKVKKASLKRKMHHIKFELDLFDKKDNSDLKHCNVSFTL